MHLPVRDAFNWLGVLRNAGGIAVPESGKYYLVVFKSQLKPDTDPALVAALDEAAHTEAKRSEALMYYFAGVPHERCALSWCLWTDMRDARKALAGPAHRNAASQAADLYESFSIELYDVFETGGQVVFEPVSKSRA